MLITEIGLEMRLFMKIILNPILKKFILVEVVSFFNETNVLGDFNNDGFTLHIDDVGKHEYVFVSFDLYIHGSWDGNFNGFTIVIKLINRYLSTNQI